MKAFVIKVKENCYWLGGFYGKNNYDDITRAKLYVNKTQAEKQCKLVNESYGHSAEIIEVTIAEGNLEQENKQLKERIDKAIEYIKLNIRDIDYDTEEYDYLMNILGDKENENN